MVRAPRTTASSPSALGPATGRRSAAAPREYSDREARRVTGYRLPATGYRLPATGYCVYTGWSIATTVGEEGEAPCVPLTVTPSVREP